MECESISKKMVLYFNVFWNKLNVLGLILYYIALILRFLPMSECFCISRILFSIDLSLWYIRALDIFSAVKRLGPKLVMIQEMVKREIFNLILKVFLNKSHD